MNILVTGGAGFIGSHIVEACLRNGHFVDVVDNLSTGIRENVPVGADLYECSFNDPTLRRLLKQRNFDVISHHAAQIDVRKSVNNPVGDLINDVAASVTLFEWAVEFGVKYLIFASSGGAIYGEQDYFPADEEHKIRPISPYGLNKWIIEQYLDFYFRQHGIKYCALRYANVYGPRQNPCSEAGVIAIFSYKMFRNEEAVINGTGEQTRDYVYISDVVSAHMSALDRMYQGIINIGTGIETSVNELFSILNKLTHISQDEKHAPPKEGEQFRSVLSFEKAKSEIQWLPKVSLQEGLKKTIAFYEKNTVNDEGV